MCKCNWYALVDGADGDEKELDLQDLFLLFH